MKSLIVAAAEHPDLRKLIVIEEPYRRQRISTLKQRFAPSRDGEEIAVWHNGVDITDQDLRKIRTKPGDKILFAPRVLGFWGAVAAAAWFLFINVVVPAAISYGVTYLGGELFGQDLPDSDKSPGGQSFGFNPRTNQIEGGVAPQAFGQNLHHGTLVAKWTDVDAAGDSDEILYLLVCFGEGPTEGNLSGEIYLNDRPLTDYSGVTTEERKGEWNQTAMTNFQQTKVEMRVGGRITNTGGPLTVTVPRTGFDDIEYTLGFDHGVWSQKKSGSFRTGGHPVLVQIAEEGTEVWTILMNVSITGYQRAPLYKAYSATAQGFTVDRTKQYKLKITKTNADNSDRRADHVSLRSVRGVVDIAFKRPGKALLGIKAVATAGLNGDIDVKVVRQDKIVNTYNGSAWVLQYSHNRAWTVYSQLTQPVITGDGGGEAYAVDSYEGFTPSQLDTAFFYEWSQMCDDQVPDGEGGNEDLMPFHHIFDTRQELWKSAYEVSQVGRAKLVWQGTTLTGWIDRAWSGSSDLITAENIEAGSWRTEWTRQNQLAGSITVNYQDASLDYKRIPWPIYNENAGKYQNQISIEAIGIKSRAGASRVGWFALKRNEMIREINSFGMHKDALKYKVGDVHPVQHNKPNWGTSYKVRRYVNSNTIELDRTVVATKGDALYVRSFNAGDGNRVTSQYTVDGISGHKVIISTSFTLQPVFDDIVAIGSTSEIKQRRITKIEWRGDHYFDITAEEYDTNLYSTDSDMPVIPYSGASAPPVRNRLDSYMTRAEVTALIEQSIPAGIDTDRPETSNIDWNDDTPSAGSVSWSATDSGETLQMRYRGTTYDITVGDTSDRFIYWIAGNNAFLSTNSEATMQTQLQNGAWMLCENRSGTAVPTTPLGNIWAGLLQAGTMTAVLGIIANAAIDNAQIANLAVGTLKIADDATGYHNSASTAGQFTLVSGYNSAQDIQYTSDGYIINVGGTVTFRYTGSGSGISILWLRITDGAGVIAEVSATQSYSGAPVERRFSIAASFIPPSSGSIRFYLEARAGLVGPWDIKIRDMSTQEFFGK